MINPFDDQTGTYFVLLNEEGQYSLWPSWIDVPAGWQVVYGKDQKESCLAYINAEWKNLIPTQLTNAAKINPVT
ncbi:MbtH protein [Thermoactinomyces sp. DSM 45891]|uniref:MbtH family protein n=1 Tax=Thermoactinomyces sp. DSM 45891 TaxID=1761907 RepID=UPI000918F1ED|nr:MbtH family protein [Thermoactinomyces sp. DSM 45891]SFX01488.1 MbtH protein [Thermoactinomyces sp. DSM 45891]